MTLAPRSRIGPTTGSHRPTTLHTDVLASSAQDDIDAVQSLCQLFRSHASHPLGEERAIETGRRKPGPEPVGAGYVFRRRPTVHKRLMLIATINLMPPALARFAILNFGQQMALPVSLTVMMLLLGGVVAFDLRTTRRVHPAVAWGAAATLLVPMVAPRLAATAPALAFADLFR